MVDPARARVIAAYVDAELSYRRTGLLGDEWLILADALEEYGRTRLARNLRTLVFLARRRWNAIVMKRPRERTPAQEQREDRLFEQLARLGDSVGSRLFREFGAEVHRAMPEVRRPLWSASVHSSYAMRLEQWRSP